MADGLLHIPRSTTMLVFHILATDWLDLKDHLSLLLVDSVFLTDVVLLRDYEYLVQYREAIDDHEWEEAVDRQIAAEVRRAHWLERRRLAQEFRRDGHRFVVDGGSSSEYDDSDSD